MATNFDSRRPKPAKPTGTASFKFQLDNENSPYRPGQTVKTPTDESDLSTSQTASAHKRPTPTAGQRRTTRPQTATSEQRRRMRPQTPDFEQRRSMHSRPLNTEQRRTNQSQTASGTRRPQRPTSTRVSHRRPEKVSHRRSRKVPHRNSHSSAIALQNLKLFTAKLKELSGFSPNESRTAILKQCKHIFLFPIVFLYFEILLRFFDGTGVFSNIFYLLIFSIALGLLCSCVTSLFPRKTNRIISIILLIVIGILFITECLVKNSFSVYMTLSAILAGAGGVVGGYSSELFSAILYGIPVILAFLLPGILYIIWGSKLLPAVRQTIPFAVIVLVCSLIFSGIGSFAASVGSSKEKYKTQFEFDTATQFFGLLTTFRLDGQNAIFGKDDANTFILDNSSNGAAENNGESNDESETAESEAADLGDNVLDLNLDERIASTSDEGIKSLHSYVNSLTPSNKNAYTGLFKGKNLILICAEAFSDVVINEELTPTLYRLAHNGFYFSDYYQPTWGGSTSSGEYSFITGLAPLNGVNTMLDTRGKNNYYTMGSQLQRLGYFSRAYHNGTHDYYSRNETHENLGYDQFLALGNGLEEITGGWPRDGVFFDLTMDTYIDQQPFSIYYMTVSGHCPYKSDHYKSKDNIEGVQAVYGDKYKRTTLDYFAYQMELEKALTTMVEKLETAGIADDTVIALTSDHYPYGLEKSSTFGNSEDYVTDLYGYKYTNSWEKDHNSLIIWSGCLENENKDMAREISEPTYSLDIVPTLSNLFGVEYDSRLLVGRDVFSDTEPLVLWNNHSWITTEGKYNAVDDTFTPNEGSTVDDAYVERMKSVVANKLTFSGEALKKDYYNVLFGQ